MNNSRRQAAGVASIVAAFNKGFENYNAHGSRAVTVAKSRICSSCAVRAKIRELNDAIDDAVARIREEWSIAGVFSWIALQANKLRQNLNLMSGSSIPCGHVICDGSNDAKCCCCPDGADPSDPNTSTCYCMAVGNYCSSGGGWTCE